MNMNQSPTIEQLKQLFATADDDAGNHSLWIDVSGNVHLSVIPDELTPIGFELAMSSMQVRFETLGEGLGYVGEAAASDEQYMSDTFRRLVRAWTPPFPPNKIRYVDY